MGCARSKEEVTISDTDSLVNFRSLYLACFIVMKLQSSSLSFFFVFARWH